MPGTVRPLYAPAERTKPPTRLHIDQRLVLAPERLQLVQRLLEHKVALDRIGQSVLGGDVPEVPQVREPADAVYHVRLRLHLDLEAMDQRAGLLLAPLGRGFGVVPGELVVQGDDFLRASLTTASAVRHPSRS